VRAEEARSQELLALGRRLAGCETPEQVAAIVTGAAATHVASDRASLWLKGGDDTLILHGASGALAADLLARGPYVSINRDLPVDQRVEAGGNVHCPPQPGRGLGGYPLPDHADAGYPAQTEVAKLHRERVCRVR